MVSGTRRIMMLEKSVMDFEHIATAANFAFVSSSKVPFQIDMVVGGVTEIVSGVWSGSAVTPLRGCSSSVRRKISTICRALVTIIRLLQPILPARPTTKAPLRRSLGER